MSSVIDNIERAQLRRVPAFEAGDRVRVHFQVVEGNRRRTQVFEGIVIKRQGTGLRETFTVRKQSFGVGVERTFPVHSPKIEQIEVAARGDVRRAKLYYLRDRVGRGARVRERRFAPGTTATRSSCPRPPRADGEGVMPPPETDVVEQAADAEAAEAEDPRDEGVAEVIEADEAAAAEAEADRRRDCGRRPPSRRPDAAGRSRPPRPTRTTHPSPKQTAAPSGPRAQPMAQTVRRGKSKDKSGNSLVELVTIVVVALGLALGIQAFLVKPFRIPSESMVPTLEVGQRVLVDRVSLRFGDPERGDIMVFKPPAGADTSECGVNHPEDQPCPRHTPAKSDTNFIKRVVGLPGDRLSVRRGRVYINGKLQKEPFIRPDASCSICNLPRPITIPKGQYYMMGDNRGESADSREWGPVPKDWFIGKAFFTYWKPDRIGTL